VLDITLTENIYLFLKELELDGFIAKDINLKAVRKLGNGTYYKKYSTLSDFYEQNKEILDNVTPNRYCEVGDTVFIENIKFQSTVTNYLLEINFYNITSLDPNIRTKTNFDYSRNDFNDFDKSKYIGYLKQSLLDNTVRNIDLANIRISAYADPCYVDPGYVADIPRVDVPIVIDPIEKTECGAIVGVGIVNCSILGLTGGNNL
jgi:hypothetical protein